MNKVTFTTGWGIGNILAAYLSWGVNHSILWGFIHGWLGWFYIIYYAMFEY